MGLSEWKATAARRFGGATVGGRRRLPLAAAGVVLVERVLMEEVGSPVALLRALGDFARS